MRGVELKLGAEVVALVDDVVEEVLMLVNVESVPDCDEAAAAAVAARVEVTMGVGLASKSGTLAPTVTLHLYFLKMLCALKLQTR